jgi:hypothetical protein
MTNKIEISRELAERLTKYYPSEITDQETMQAIRIEALAALDELRALLAAPYHVVCSNGILCQDRSCAECGGNGATEIAAPAVERQEPVACSHEWTDDGEFTLICTKCGHEENHEPYGWVQTRGDSINHFTQEWDVVQEWEDRGYEHKAMFDHASPPAPVAVVLPDDWQDQLFSEMERRFDLRKHVDDDHMVNDDTQIGVEFSIAWMTACLDKVKEMNQ